MNREWSEQINAVTDKEKRYFFIRYQYAYGTDSAVSRGIIAGGL